MPDRAARVTRSLSDSSIRNIRLRHQSIFIQTLCSPGVTATVADCPRLTFATTAPSTTSEYARSRSRQDSDAR